MKRIFGKKAVAAAIAVLFSVSLVCTGCSDGGSSGSDDSGGETNVSGGDGSGGETGGGGTEKPTIADGTYCDGMLTVKNGSVTKCDPNATGTIEIPEGVTSIGDNAFRDCKNLTSIIIPSSVQRISLMATSVLFAGGFDGCTSLKEIIVDENNSEYSSADGILFNKDKTRLLRCPRASKNMTIPDGVTEIGNAAFKYCSGLTSITIPASVTKIGDVAFGATGLASITIPNSVTRIGNYAFSTCRSLTSVTIPDSVTWIGWFAFSHCTSLASITIPNSVTEIGSDAFNGCTGLTNVTIPKSVTSIGSDAFSNCTSLTSITIPDSVTTIGYKAFSSCTNLTDITIPNSVTEIGISVFAYCDKLETIYVANETEKAKWTEEKIGKSGVTVKVIGE